MTLSEYIETNKERLLREWEAFARRAQPDDVELNRDELRDWADGLLRAIALQMKSAQSDEEGGRKSMHLGSSDHPAIIKAAQVHAMDRLAQGFNLNQMISEYISLRRSVAVLWRQQTDPDDSELDELIRFDGALDLALAESVSRYSTVLERARDLFVGALGHDMRTPLGSILVSAETLLRSPDELAGSHLQGAVRIRNAAKRINNMLQDLLDFTQTRLGGQLGVSLEETDLATLLTEVVEELRSIHPDQAIQLDCQSGLTGAFDPGRVAQMLSNLLSNAVKYGRQGTAVTVQAYPANHELIIRVHNEGKPIPRELRRTMFEPLVRGGTEQREELKKGEDGLGLGLYIAREIAEAHGGHLVLKSTDHEGTTFEVRLDRIPPSS